MICAAAESFDGKRPSQFPAASSGQGAGYAARPSADQGGVVIISGGRECERHAAVSVQPRGHSFQRADHPLPAVGRALVEGLVFGPEARLLHAHVRAAFGRRQRPGDDVFNPFAASSPEAFQL